MTGPRSLMSVMTENNGVSERKQHFSCKCHVSNIDFYNPFLQVIVQEPLPLPATSPLAPLCLIDILDVMLGSISRLDL